MAWQQQGRIPADPEQVNTLALAQSQRRPAVYTRGVGHSTTSATWDASTAGPGDLYIELATGAVRQASNGALVGDIRRSGAQVLANTATVLDNGGTVNLGSTGRAQVTYSVKDTFADLTFDIIFGGTGKRSGGGPLRLRLPIDVRRWNVPEYYGSGILYLAGAALSFQITPATVNSDELQFFVPENGASGIANLARIWDGRNGSGTGLPLNPNFSWDADGTRLSGTVRFRTNADDTFPHVPG